MRALLLVLTAVFTACRKPAPPAAPAPTVVAGEAMADYVAATGEFSCLAPASWRALEDKTTGPRVIFFGPGSERRPNPVAISVLRYPDGGKLKTPQDYWDAQKLSGRNPSPLEKRLLGGKTVYSLHEIAPLKRADVVMLPIPNGFFALVYSAPADAYETTLPIFDAVVASFAPKK